METTVNIKTAKAVPQTRPINTFKRDTGRDKTKSIVPLCISCAKLPINDTERKMVKNCHKKLKYSRVKKPSKLVKSISPKPNTLLRSSGKDCVNCPNWPACFWMEGKSAIYIHKSKIETMQYTASVVFLSLKTRIAIVSIFLFVKF